VQRSGTRQWIHYRCTVCRREWTITEDNLADLVDPVTVDEIIRVHELLAGDVTIDELVKR
jgi:hypothetical protein